MSCNGRTCHFRAQWVLYIPGYSTLKISTFFPHVAFMCFVLISEETETNSPYSNNWVVFITDTESMKREDQQDATIRCFLLTSVSTCFGHHYAQLQENKGPVTAFGVFWFCWMWLVAVVGRCLAGYEQLMPIFRRTKALLLHLVCCSGSAGCGW